MADDRPICTLDLDAVTWTECAEDSGARSVAGVAQLQCEILRIAPRRRVLKTLTAPPLLIKQYFHHGPIQFLKNYFRGAPARREWRALRSAAKRGLPVPKPLALGFGAGSSVLVTEFIDGAGSVDELLRDSLKPGSKRAVLRQAALLLRAMHDAGCYQRDLHLGNLLRRERAGKFDLWLIDLQRVDVDPGRALASRWRDLAALHGGTAASATERLRFLKTYLSVTPALCSDEPRLVAQLDRAGRRHRFRLWRSRRKRCCADNWEFCRIQAGALSGFARRSVWSAGLQAALAAPRGLPADAVIVKDSRTTTVATVMVDGRKLFIKRYNFQGAAYALKDLLRSARAKRGWRVANDCRMRGIDAALPAAYLERRCWRVLRESYVVTAGAEGEELAELLARRGADLCFKRELIGALARWLRRLHDRGVAPRDLKGENIIVAPDSSGYRFHLVDFDGIACGAVRRRARARQLARLARAVGDEAPPQAGDRLRLVKNYLGAGQLARRRKLYHALSQLLARA